MTALRRVYLCCFLVLAVLGTTLPVQAQSESEPSSEPDSITLEQEMSLEVPATGGRLLLSDASALDPTGAVLVEPETDNEELVQYESVEDNTLVNIVRDDPRSHDVGVAVEQSEEDISASPSPNPTPTPTASPSPSPTPTASTDPVPLPSTYPVAPGSDEPASEPESSPDRASTESIALAQDMNFLIPGDGGGLLLTDVSGLDPSGGAILIDPGTEREETVFYETVDADANALVEIHRPIPGFHSAGAPVTATSTTLASFCEISNLLCPVDETVVGEIIERYCPDLRCDVDVLLEEMCGPNGATKCDVDGTLLPFVIEELCSLAEGCSIVIPELVEELLADLCGSEWPGGCDVVGLIQRIIDERCPNLSCPQEVLQRVIDDLCLQTGGCFSAIRQLIEERLADLCGPEWPGGCDVVGLIERIIDERCPGLQCGDDELAFVVQLVTSTLNSVCGGDPRTACEPYITSIISGLITELCGPSGLEGCEGLLTEQVEGLIATWCPNGPPNCNVVPLAQTGLTQLQVWDVNIFKMDLNWRAFIARMSQNAFAPDIITVNELVFSERFDFMDAIEDRFGTHYAIAHGDEGIGPNDVPGRNAVIYNTTRLRKVGNRKVWLGYANNPDDDDDESCSTRRKNQIAVDLVDKLQEEIYGPKHVLVAAVHIEREVNEQCVKKNTALMDNALESLQSQRDLSIIGGDFNERPITRNMTPDSAVRTTGVEVDPACWYREFSAAHLDFRVEDQLVDPLGGCPGTLINRYYDTVWLYPGSGGGTNPASPAMCEQWTWTYEHQATFRDRAPNTACTDLDDNEAGYGRIDYIWVGWETSLGEPLRPRPAVAAELVDYASADLGFDPVDLQALDANAYSDHRAVQALLRWPVTP